MVPKVSIIIPVYNVDQYLEECLDSVIGQTLREIEIICVNDGSSDSSPAIIRRYADRDSRIVPVDKPNGGYGKAMNAGLALARADYIGIVESDDYAAPEMFETLYSKAIENDCDIVKEDFFQFIEGEAPQKRGLLEKETCNRILTPEECQSLFLLSPSIWSGLYRRKMIEDNDISFSETPGASYQDTAFSIMALMCARRIMLLPSAHLFYRQYRKGSSAASTDKVFCVCDEFDRVEFYIKTHPDLRRFLPIILAKKFYTYDWNYHRLDRGLRPSFALRAAHEFQATEYLDYYDERLFAKKKWADLNLLIEDVEGYLAQDKIYDAFDSAKFSEQPSSVQVKNNGGNQRFAMTGVKKIRRQIRKRFHRMS